MNPIIAQSIIAEMAEQYNQLATHYTRLIAQSGAPGTLHWQATDRELLQIEIACATWKAAAYTVARQAGIKLTWSNRRT